MAYQSIFKRYELKYLLTYEQKQRMLLAMEPYMSLDSYGRTTIRNLYLDTENYRLIRRSVEKPLYKEKLRIRSYQQATADSTVFVELKKKYDGVVYKRRIALPEREAVGWIIDGGKCPVDNQISREIDYFRSHYGPLSPSVFLSYEREAYYDRLGGDFRVTFDDNILFRGDDLSLCSEAYGTPILPEGRVMMELKCSGATPLWMAQALSCDRIYKTSFSKYGRAYEQEILPRLLAPSITEKELIVNG